MTAISYAQGSTTERAPIVLLIASVGAIAISRAALLLSERTRTWQRRIRFWV